MQEATTFLGLMLPLASHNDLDSPFWSNLKAKYEELLQLKEDLIVGYSRLDHELGNYYPKAVAGHKELEVLMSGGQGIGGHQCVLTADFDIMLDMAIDIEFQAEDIMERFEAPAPPSAAPAPPSAAPAPPRAEPAPPATAPWPPPAADPPGTAPSHTSRTSACRSLLSSFDAPLFTR